MTPAEWDASDSLEELLAASALPEGHRTLRLFNAACARRVTHLMPDDDARRLVDLAEQRAEGTLSDDAWLRAVFETVDPYIGNEAACDIAGGATFGVLMHLHQTDSRSVLRLAGSVVEAAAFVAYTDGHPITTDLDDWMRKAVESEAWTLCDLFRCVCGNPLLPVVLDPRWLTSDVLALAEGVSSEQAFDRMPILADALQDAHCDHAGILGHCRSGGPHARGCWVVDLIRARGNRRASPSSTPTATDQRSAPTAPGELP